MKRLLVLGLVTTLSFSISADTGFCPLDEDNNPVSPFGTQLVLLKKEESREIYKLKGSENNPYPVKEDVWTVTRDKSGRTIKVETGKLPSSEEIAFLNKKKKLELELESKINTHRGLSLLSNSVSSLTRPEVYPIEYGSVMEFDYKDKNCLIKSISKRSFNQIKEKSQDITLFDANKCESINDLYSKNSKLIKSCEKVASLDNPFEDAALVSGTVGGIGGGGGAPIREIASIEEAIGLAQSTYLISGFSKGEQGLSNAYDWCKAFVPQTKKAPKKPLKQSIDSSSSNQ